MDNIFLHLFVVFYLLTYKNIIKYFPCLWRLESYLHLLNNLGCLSLDIFHPSLRCHLWWLTQRRKPSAVRLFSWDTNRNCTNVTSEISVLLEHWVVLCHPCILQHHHNHHHYHHPMTQCSQTNFPSSSLHSCRNIPYLQTHCLCQSSSTEQIKNNVQNLE